MSLERDSQLESCENKKCEYCSGPLPLKYPQRRFCSRKCRNSRKNDYYRSELKKAGIPAGTVGAISELAVCVDLLKRGYHVFRAVSPTCPCDLVAFKNERTIKFEVRTAAPKKTGGLTFAKQPFNADHFAIVFGEQILYDPELT